MSDYAKYCQDQATACARRAGLASSPEIVTYCRNLEFRWLKLAKQAHETGGVLGHERNLTVDFASAAGEARGIPDRVCKTSQGS